LRLLQNYCVLKGYVRINPCSAMIFFKMVFTHGLIVVNNVVFLKFKA